MPNTHRFDGKLLTETAYQDFLGTAEHLWHQTKEKVFRSVPFCEAIGKQVAHSGHCHHEMNMTARRSNMGDICMAIYT